MIDTTIVIPAYKPVALLKQCIESIVEYTDLTKVKITVVCNGSDKESEEYILSKPYIKLLWFEDALGYPRATNEGLKTVDTPYVILLNTDITLLSQKKHEWVNILLSPLKENKQVAITGFNPIWMHFRSFVPFWGAALRTDVVKELGYLDEIFSPGYGEDADLCFKAVNADYDIVSVGHNHVIHHSGQSSFKEERQYLSDRAYGILRERYFDKHSSYIAS